MLVAFLYMINSACFLHLQGLIMLKSLLRQQLKAEDEGAFLSQRLRDTKARVTELFDENKVLRADRKRALKHIEVLEAERAKPDVDAIKYMALAEEHAKITEELRLERSLRARCEEDLHKAETDLAACRAALEEEHRAHVQASKEGAEFSVEVVNQEAQLE